MTKTEINQYPMLLQCKSKNEKFVKVKITLKKLTLDFNWIFPFAKEKSKICRRKIFKKIIFLESFCGVKIIEFGWKQRLKIVGKNHEKNSDIKILQWKFNEKIFRLISILHWLFKEFFVKIQQKKN